MSQTGGRRKSNLKTVSTKKVKVQGPKLKFKWSTSAARLAEAEENLSTTLPAIPVEPPRRRGFTVSSLSTGKFN